MIGFTVKIILLLAPPTYYEAKKMMGGPSNAVTPWSELQITWKLNLIDIIYA